MFPNDALFQRGIRGRQTFTWGKGAMSNQVVSALFAGEATAGSQVTIDRALETVRTCLGMEVALLSQFVDENVVFRAVNAPGLEEYFGVGDAHLVEDTYCGQVVAGCVPQIIPHTGEHPVASQMRVTLEYNLGSYVGVPIRYEDGSLYGMFCCFATQPNKSLNERDLKMMEAFADLSTAHVLELTRSSCRETETRSRIAEVLERRDFSMAYQPIFDLRSLERIGFEALCRFRSVPYRSPHLWFNEAVATGQATELELAAIEMALEEFNRLPGGSYLSLNVSPATVLSEGLAPLLARVPGDRLVLELTEHARVADYDQLIARLGALRCTGIRIAIDDVGAGYSSLRHIVQIAPDFIKLDMSLTRDVDTNPARRSLAHALVHFSRETGAAIIAEGIEHEGEAEALKILGVRNGQGYFLGKPLPLDEALAQSDIGAATRLSA